MSKKSKVVKLSSKARTTGREALVTYEGEKITRVEREARIREKNLKTQESAPVEVVIKKGTKVAEAKESKASNSPKIQKQVKPEEKKAPTGNEWYFVVLKFLANLCSYTLNEVEKKDANDDSTDQWSIFVSIFSFIPCCKDFLEDNLDAKAIAARYKGLAKTKLVKNAKEAAKKADKFFDECKEHVENLNKVLADIANAKTPKDADEKVREEFNAKRAQLRKERNSLEKKLAKADEYGRALEREADIYGRLIEVLTEEEVFEFRKSGRFEPKTDKYSKTEIDILIQDFKEEK